MTSRSSAAVSARCARPRTRAVSGTRYAAATTVISSAASTTGRGGRLCEWPNGGFLATRTVISSGSPAASTSAASPVTPSTASVPQNS